MSELDIVLVIITLSLFAILTVVFLVVRRKKGIDEKKLMIREFFIATAVLVVSSGLYYSCKRCTGDDQSDYYQYRNARTGEQQPYYQGSREQKQDLEAIDKYSREHPDF